MVEEMEQTNHVKRCKLSSSIQTVESTDNLPADFISDLPDSLRLHILSLLDMDQVIKTSLLSKKWRYLWKSIPCLHFEHCSAVKYPNFIDRCLFHHEGSKIHKLHINFVYEEDTHAPPADSWIHFAIRCQVEDLEFRSFCLDEIYKLPRTLYLCGTLTSLTLSQCNLNLPQSFQLGSLKKLSLRMIELNPDWIEHLSSSCPVLEDIDLFCYNHKTDLNIVITNHHVKLLKIHKAGKLKSGTIKINAPTLLSLGIYNCCPSVSTVRFHVKELGSLKSANIIGKQGYHNCCEDADFGRIWLRELLYDLCHVKQLKLCGWCLLVLSLIKLKSLELLSISARCLKLQASLTKWELPGVIYLLQSCSNLKTLKTMSKDHFDEIELTDEFIDKHDFQEQQYWGSLESADAPSIMQKVKIIEINDLSGTSHEKFVQYFLRKAKVLKRMVINTPKEHANNFELLFKLISQSLNVFPRSSPTDKLLIQLSDKLSTLDS